MFKQNSPEPESKLEDLIKNEASLEELFDDPLYLEEITFQNENLFKYLAKDKIIKKLFNYIYIPKITEKTNFEKISKYSFYAYSTIANCSSEITSIIIKNPIHLKNLFSLINKNDENTITSRGYFQMIIKNMLSDLNPYLNQFIKVLKINPELYIFPLIKNLTKANSEIIKDILGTNEKKIKKLQLCVFEFLLFFYLNEQFDNDNKNIDDIFDNIIDIFHFLNIQEELIYNYKLKYEYTLYSDEYVNKKKFSEQIYYLKLALLRYIAITKQIKTCKNPEKFLLSFRKFKKSKKIFFYLKELLEFFSVLSTNKEFFKNVNLEFYKNLLSILEEFPYKDILHKIIFQILFNSKENINKNKKTLLLITNFILLQEKNLKFPNEKKKSQNKISLHNIYNLLKEIDLKKIENKENSENLQIYRDLLSTLFTKLCFTEEINDFSEVEEHSDVELVLKKDFHLYKNKKKRSIPNDKRFHYEDDIMQPELISNPEIDRINNEIFENKNESDLFKSENKGNLIDSDFSDFENLEEKNPLTVLNDFKDRSLLENSERMKNELFSPNNSNFEENKTVGKSGLFDNKNILFSSDEKGDKEN